MASLSYNTKYPSIEDLRSRAQKKTPRFAFEYMDGGCNEDVNLRKNTDEIRQVELVPRYFSNSGNSDLKTELFGHTYDAPFGISPIGLQGLMWPGATKILAKAAVEHNIPFILSTMATSSIEEISKITEGRAWYQLYHPKENALKDKILQRAQEASVPVLVLLCDVPTFAFRPRDIRNGLALPPKMTFNNILQMIGRPHWSLATLMEGQPKFANLIPYLPKGLDLGQLGLFMNQTFSGLMNEEKIKSIRDKWKGKIIMKGVASESDMEMCVRLGLDGVMLSNHGGRQLDAGQSTIATLKELAPKYKGKIKIMLDSGIRSGPDIARTLAQGADFAFLGRSFMYGVAALGKAGGQHTIAMLKIQLQQVLEQIGCSKVEDLHQHLVSK
ncbi:MAG: alpha-hydroxy-acid oxidizing protein [Saprospiraceae bacterium]|nr:alpha-hydroxy-acid oxidizing protein [Saprospiraceae bacterium]MBL0109916.1 alpha-hydroxy-acid oxidizing protein [Saprospiraceae bacterium]MBP7803631.1 alpha-hydroxy-acid oxidizing protein [Saprospiraceae bacterium]MBP8095478.1 alpha-hydroxy-acid oxidizing protein [Saprospiraceae bacterium]